MRNRWLAVGVTLALSGCLEAVEEKVVCAGSGACSDSVASPAAEADLLARWNAAVDALAPTLTRDFHWRNLNDFPHPTFRLGDATAYTECARVLVRFYASGDNLDFVVRQHLQGVEFKSGPPVASQATVSFCGLTRLLSSFELVAPEERDRVRASLAPLGC